MEVHIYVQRHRNEPYNCLKGEEDKGRWGYHGGVSLFKAPAHRYGITTMKLPRVVSAY
jgi:hypothetical protein